MKQGLAKRAPRLCARHAAVTFEFTALVEGSTGKVLATVFPEKPESPYYLVAGLGLLLFAVLGLVVANPLLKILVYSMTALPLALLAYWVTRRV